MKKFIILAIILLSTSISFGQEDLFNKWAVSVETGAHSVSDPSALVDDNYNHFGLDLRYNINEIVGVGVRGAFDNLSLITIEGNNVETDYLRLNAEATVSVFEILRLRHKNINLLFHGGPGASFVDVSDGSYNGKLFNMSGGMTALVKLSRSFAAKADYTSTIHLSQDRTLDGAFPINNAGVNSVVDNLSIGLVYYWGKGKKHNGGKKNNLEHADWYVPVPVQPVVNNITEVTKNVTEVTQVIEQPCECKVQEFVFFAHDKYVIRESALNGINKVFTYLSENPDSKLTIYGFASDTQSSNEYNLELSANRANAITEKLTGMGISQDRIKSVPEGKDFNYSNESIHDMARRVELIIE